MSGLVIVQYWSAPTRCLRFRERGSPTVAESLELEIVGAEHGLAPIMEDLDNKS
jgi:hypothetical protein